MNLEIFEGNKNTVKLHLEKDCDGEVSLVVVDEDGDSIDGGYLLTLTPDGKIKRIPYVNKALGFDLDHTGRINIS